MEEKEEEVEAGGKDEEASEVDAGLDCEAKYHANKESKIRVTCCDYIQSTGCSYYIGQSKGSAGKTRHYIYEPSAGAFQHL